MATGMKRTTISLPADLERAVNDLKQRDYYNKSFSELYRDLIRHGVEALDSTNNKPA